MLVLPMDLSKKVFVALCQDPQQLSSCFIIEVITCNDTFYSLDLVMNN